MNASLNPHPNPLPHSLPTHSHQYRAGEGDATQDPLTVIC